MRSLRILTASIIAIALIAGCSKTKTEGWDAETFYINAKEQLDKKKWSKAIELFQQLEGRYPYGEYAEQAQLEIGYAYYKNNDQAEALAAADRFIRLHPTHPSVDYAYYLKGLVNFTENKTTLDKLLGGKDFSDRDPNSALASYQAFNQLITRYPDSRYYNDAVVRMKTLTGYLARHDLYVADYYLRRGAYVAVVNRCKYVLETHQHRKAVENALGLMMVAYERMEMVDLAADTKRILALNYPDSLYLSDTKRALANVRKN
ncbi:MAG: outer membrane protein assembly factor BamD [Arenicellales bacterium]|nr:outer membrane protein assembly factor BamD [Arenicellales bacterium]